MDAIERLRAAAQTEATVLALNNLLRLREQEIIGLRAELAECRSKPQELHLHATGDPIDCRTCNQFYEGACLLLRFHCIVCINGDAYIATDPVRLYETNGGG